MRERESLAAFGAGASRQNLPGNSARSDGKLAVALVAGMTVASLFGFNRNDLWDETALYFFGAFGLGILCSWALRLPRATLWLGLLALVAVAALAVAVFVSTPPGLAISAVVNV